MIHKLVREIVRGEDRACEHAERVCEQHGDVPPTAALRAIQDHVETLRDRLVFVGTGYGISMSRARIRSTLSQLRNRVVEKLSDDERGYQFALDDLRETLELVKALRGVARTDGLIGFVRWCDDWLIARRTLVARASAQLAWYMEREQRGDDDQTRDY